MVIEALASGLPVVGSASGGLPEMVPPACGVLRPPAPLVWDKMITPTGEELATAVQALVPACPKPLAPPANKPKPSSTAPTGSPATSADLPPTPRMSTPPVSVLMTVFNAEAHLEAAIQGILDQTFRDFEFLIIDDASTDQSVKIARDWAEKDVRIRVVTNETNKGQTHLS